MRPTSPDLIAGVADALEWQVLPVVQDKWAASTLRSAMQLLRHLALRVEQEPRILVEEACDLRGVLQAAQAKLAAPTRVSSAIASSAIADLSTRLEQSLELREPAAHEVAAMAARDEQWLTVVESLLAARDRLDAALGDTQLRDALVAYLERRLLRERELIEPFRSSPPI